MGSEQSRARRKFVRRMGHGPSVTAHHSLCGYFLQLFVEDFFPPSAALLVKHLSFVSPLSVEEDLLPASALLVKDFPFH